MELNEMLVTVPSDGPPVSEGDGSETTASISADWAGSYINYGPKRTLSLRSLNMDTSHIKQSQPTSTPWHQKSGGTFPSTPAASV